MNALPSLLTSAAPTAATPAATPTRAAAREADAPRGFAKALGAAREQAPRTEAERAAKAREAADGPKPGRDGQVSNDAAATEARDAGSDTATEADTDTRARDDDALAGTPAAPATDTRSTALRAMLPGAATLRTAADAGTAATEGTDDAPAGTGPAVAPLAIDSRGDALRGLRHTATAAGRAASVATPADRAAVDGTETPAGRFADALAAAGTAAASPTATAVASARVAELPPAAASPAGALAGAPASAPSTPPPAAAEATLPSPPGSPAFAGELAARLTTFVRDGVEQARLHLNPAEMGPVEVRIHLDGDAARVLMSADLAPTRQWLEQALPTLAATLRDAGLTLAGGGVFEQASGGQTQGGASGDSGRSRPGDSAAQGTDTALPATVPARRRGVVDLVA
jgi:flagellar hook-length control protein FliK